MSTIIKTESYFCFHNISNSLTDVKHKIFGFDLDYTLVRPISNRKFSRDENDWRFMFNSSADIITKLNDIAKDKRNIIFILTNQNFKDTSKSFNKCKRVYLSLIEKVKNINMIMFGATLDDFNRKPRIGSLKFLNTLVKFDNSDMIYVGDACGRESDFSDTDYKFAINAGCSFNTPEEFFLETKEQLTPPRNLFQSSNLEDIDELCNNIFKLFNDLCKKVKVIVMIGAPASGKSYLSNLLIQKKSNNGSIINQDTLKTFNKCKKEFINQITINNFVIIDNTNRDKATRNNWVNVFNKYSNTIEYKFIYLKTNKEKSLHCLAYRNYKQLTNMSKIAITMFYSKLEHPDNTELNNNLIVIDNFVDRFRPHMNISDYKEFCMHWT